MPVRITDEKAPGLVARIYDAALDPARWSEFLDAFARAVDSQGTLIFTHNFVTLEANTALSTAVNFDPAFVHALSEHSRHTAANQLKRVFDKTGMRRQSELVRWVHQCKGVPFDTR